jgi:hypothetical protein
MWARTQQAVTVRQGDHVIIGDEDAGVLGRAQEQLNAGDLAGAVATLGKLSAPAAAAMESWLDNARALLAARSALAGLAAKS